MKCKFIYEGAEYDKAGILSKIIKDNLYVKGDKMAAEKWLNEKLGEQHVEYVAGLINGDAFGQFQKDGTILLSDIFEKGTEYHEAFHRVWQTMLTPKQRRDIENEIPESALDRVKELYPNLSEKKLKEEYLAEQFRDYVVNNGEIEFPKKTRNFFTTLFDLLKKLFGVKKLNMNELFQNIERGDYKNFKTSYPVVITPMQSVSGFSVEESAEVVRSISQKLLAKLFNSTDGFRKFVSGQIPGDYIADWAVGNHSESAFSQVLAELDKSGKYLESSMIEGKRFEFYKQTAKYLKQFKIEMPDYEDEKDLNESQDKDYANYQESFKTDDKTRFSSLVKLLLASIPDSKKSEKYGLTINTDWSTLSSQLAVKLSGKAISTDALFRELKAIGKPETDSLLEILGGTNKQFIEKFRKSPKEALQQFYLRQEFHNAFTKHYYEFYVTGIENGKIWTYDSNREAGHKRIENEYKNKIEVDVQRINLWMKENPDSISSLLDAYKNWEETGEKVFGNKNHLINFEVTKPDHRPSFDTSKTLDTIVREISSVFKKELTKAENAADVIDSVSGYLGRLAAGESSYRSEVELSISNVEGNKVFPVNLHTFQTTVLDSLNYYLNMSWDSMLEEFENLLNEGVIKQENYDAMLAEAIENKWVYDTYGRPTEIHKYVTKARLPFLFNAYTENSVWVNKALELGQVPVLTVYDGVSPKGDVDGKALADLDPTDLFAAFVNGLYNPNGQIVYPAFKHSDRSVMYGYRLKYDAQDELVKENIEKEFVSIYEGYLKDQQRLEEAYNSNVKLYKDVAHFKPQEDNKKLLQEKDAKKVLAEQVRMLREKLEYNGNLKMIDGKPVGISLELWEAAGKDLNTVLTYLASEGFIGFIEQTKMFTGNPGFYSSASNFFKRMNAQSSTGSPGTVDSVTNEVMTWLNKQTALEKGIKYEKKTDGRITELVSTEVDSYESSVAQQIYDKYFEYATKNNIADPEKYANRFKRAYSKVNENDGQSWINLFAWREFYVRTEGWNPMLQRAFDMEMDIYNGKDVEVFDTIFNEIMPRYIQAYKPLNKKTKKPITEEYYRENPGEFMTVYFDKFVEAFRPIKGQYMGPVSVSNENGGNNDLDSDNRVFVPAVRKTSYMPLIPSMIKGTNLEKLNRFMIEEGKDILHMESGSKVGTRKTIPMYNEEGQFVLPQVYREAKERNDSSYDSELDFRFMKNQVKISGHEKEKIINATQARKNMLQNFRNPDGTWVDEKLAKEYIDLHTQIVNLALEEIDKFVNADTKTFVDKIRQGLKDEPENILNALELLSEEGFLEMLPNRNKVENIIFAAIGKKGVRIKANGNAYVQAAVSMFESGDRKQVYTKATGITHRIPMNFEDGSGGRKMKPEYAGKSTIELIKEGKRTATSRDRSKPYNQQNIKVNDIIEFYANSGKSKGETVKVVVTKAPYKLENVSKETWSDLEGWDGERYEKEKKDGYEQFQFKLLNEEGTFIKRDSSGTPLLQSSDELKFYLDKDGNIQEAEVMLPLPQAWIPKILKHYGTHNLAKAIEKLNEEMAEGKWENHITFKGLRIPNQQVSSNDIFKVKKFFLPTVSNMVVVPAEIVVKTGSDFDVDKLQLYMPNLTDRFEYINFDTTDEVDYAHYINSRIKDDDIREKVKKSISLTQSRSWGAYKARLNKLKSETKDVKKSLIQEFWDDLKTYPKMVQDFTKLAMNSLDEDTSFVEKLGTAWATINSEIDNMEEINDYGEYPELKLLLTEYKFLAATIKDFTEELMALEENKQIAIENVLKKSKDRSKELWNSLQFKIAQEKSKVYNLESFDDFAKKSEVQKKSIQQLENRLIQIDREILLHPDNFHQTLGVIDDDLLKFDTFNDLQKTLEEAVEKNPKVARYLKPVLDNMKFFKDKSSAKFYDILNIPQQVQQKVNAVDSKFGVGIVATEITGHTIFQLHNVKVNETMIVESKDKDGNTIQRRIDTRVFSKGEDLYALNSIYDTEGNVISEVLSVVLTSQVDAGKNPYATILNINKNTLAVLTYMIRRGESVKNAIYLLNQPIVSEYLRLSNINKSLLYRTEHQESFGNVQGNNLKLNDKKLIELVKSEFPNVEKEGQGYRENLVEVTNQHEMLERFLNIKLQSDVMLKYKQGSSPDTTVPKNMMQYETEKKSNLEADKSALLVGADEITESGLLSGFFRVRDRMEDLKKYYYMYKIPGYAQRMLEIGDHIFKPDRKQKMLDKINSEFPLYLIQNHPEYKGLFTRLFKPQDGNNIGVRIIKASEKFDNVLLSVLASRVKLSEQERGDWSGIPSIKFFEPKDPYALNNFIEHFQNIKSLDEELFKDLILTSLLQSGTNPSVFSWLSIFPNNDFDAELFKKVFGKKPEEIDFDNYLGLFFRNNPDFAPKSLKGMNKGFFFEKNMIGVWDKTTKQYKLRVQGTEYKPKGTYHVKNYEDSRIGISPVANVVKPNVALSEKSKMGFKLSIDKTGKDQGKANYANAFIGFGVQRVKGMSSTGVYLEDAKKQGIPVNNELIPNRDTVAFVSVSSEGTYVKETVELAKKVINAGGVVIMDKSGTGYGESHSSFNRKGEGAVQDALGAPTGKTKEGYNWWRVSTATDSNQPLKSEVKTYSGLITKLEPNQVFVFGSNPVGINGNPAKGTGGAALVATNNGWVVQNEKMDNRLSNSGKAWGLTTVAYPGKRRSKSESEIKAGISKLYEFAKSNPTKEFLVAYTGTGTNLNGYSNQELANMFSSFPIPSNIVFEERFSTLLKPASSQLSLFEEKTCTSI